MQTSQSVRVYNSLRTEFDGFGQVPWKSLYLSMAVYWLVRWWLEVDRGVAGWSDDSYKNSRD